MSRPVDMKRAAAALAALDRAAAQGVRPMPDIELEGLLMAKTKTKTGETVAVAFRLEQALLKRLDAHAARMAGASPGLSFNRSDVVRVLLLRALEAEERKAR